MNWREVVKSSESYWKPKQSPWDFCGMCCNGDSQQPKQIRLPSSNHPAHEKRSHITHYWSREDDKKLIKLAAKYNCNWAKVEEKFPEKTAAQLSRRWNKKLNPNLKHGPWTIEEDTVLKALVLEIGYDWENISKYVPGRSAEVTKKRFTIEIFPCLTQKEMIQLHERLNRKSESETHSMDIESSGGEYQSKDEHLQALHSRVLGLEESMEGTLMQIEQLESEIFDTQNLLS